MDTNEFTKPGGVVIPGGLGITIGLKNWIGSNNLVLKGDLLDLFLARGSNQGQVGDDLLGVLSLASTRLSSNQHGLVLGIGKHVAISSFRNGPQVWWDFIPSLANVQLDHTLGVDGESLIGVDHNTEKARV